jgi:uncharacterized repeat protein (TIGR01451 family)
MIKKLNTLMILAMVISLVLPVAASAQLGEPPTVPVTFTILHTNDFHGQLEPSGSNPGMARLSYQVEAIRTAVGAANVLMVDAGDEMQGSLLSNLWHGEPVIAVYNAMDYVAATFGNHEFDWGQPTLITRTEQADYPYVSANIVVNDTGDCATAGWSQPSFVAAPYVIQTIGTAPDAVNVGFIGVTTQETPYITIASATEGLCFKDPSLSIQHYYDELNAQTDVIVVLSHLGFTDGGYGYGFDVYGDQTLAQKLITAGKPVNLIIGGHSHTNVSLPPPVVGGVTTVVQARYNGRQLGRADITVNTDGSVGVVWSKIDISTSGPVDTEINDLIMTYVNDPVYQQLINTPIGYAQTDLLRNYNGDSMMGYFVDDAIYQQLNNDTEPLNDVDMFFNNAGGIRTDWCDAPDPVNPGQYIWSSNAADCQPGVWAHDPMVLNYGQMFTILPFGNATIVGDMTGAQILQLLNQSATLFTGALQPAGMRYNFYRYSDALPGPQPWAWGAFDPCVINKGTGVCEPLDLQRTYRVGTNEFLAPAGQDGYVPFKYMTNISYWGDMLNAVNAWVTANYTFDDPYKGPNGDGMLDGRITRDGTDTGGSIIPVTLLHHNDSHGRLVKVGTTVGYTQLATLIKQERLHNPNRTLLFTLGDNIQGDSMMYYFKTAALGYAADGTALPPSMWINPLIKAFNAMNYDAYTLGNHEFNFGHEIFTSSLKTTNFPVLQANLTDDGQYGIAEVPVQPYIEKMVGPESVRVAILGIGNHRVPNYELPSNIPGLTFTNPIDKAQELSDQLRATNDIVLALTHIGFTENPASVEVDNNVDTYMATEVSGLDAIIGGHSHTNPSTGFGPYKFLPTILGGPGNMPVLINQAYRYNTYLGELVIGLKPKTEGFGYDVVSRAGRYISVPNTTVEDPDIAAIAAPYVAMLTAYNNTAVVTTTVPIDALQAFTQETNGANLQADASVWELEDHHGIDVDFHLSGAMTNAKVAASATPDNPVLLKVSDMFSLMPYENSLVVMEMNGPQLKAVLERGYRNYYYYKYVSGYGGYSYYTTCFLSTNAGNQITYNDTYPALPNGNNVVSLEVGGQFIDFNDADTYYRVSTVNYLAAGSCNFNDGGVSLWPLNQITNDTQFYVRDAVIYYGQEMQTISPQIEGRLVFNAAPDLSSSVKSVKDESGDGLAQVDETLDYTIQISNTGGISASVMLTDSLPAGVTYVPDSLVLPATFTGSVTDNVLTAQSTTDLAPDSSVAIQFQATVNFPPTLGEEISNKIELADQSANYDIPAATIPLQPYARLAVAHLAPFAPDPGTTVTVTLDGAPAIIGFEFADALPYLYITAGVTHTVEVFPAGSVTPAISADINLEEGKDYSAIATGGANGWSLRLLALADDNTAPTAGNFKLRLGHLAPFADSITGTLADVRLQDGTVILDDVPFGAIAGYLELPAGEYDLKITTPDGGTTLIDPKPVTFNDGDIVSAFAVGDGVNQPLGVFAWPSDSNGILLPLEEPVTPMARLAVGHLAPFAMDPNTAVTVTLDGTAVLTGFEFADSTAYLDVEAGITHTVEIFAAGVVTPAISAQINLMEGMDYSAIAVGGANGWPLELLALADDNTAPAAGNFKLRLGHLAPFTDTITGTLADVRLQDGTVILDDVPFGAIAGYLELPAGTYDLKITTPDGGTILIDPLPVTFSEGMIVSAFAVGDGINQPLGVFAWPSDAVGFLLPLKSYGTVYLPLIPQGYMVP